MESLISKESGVDANFIQYGTRYAIFVSSFAPGDNDYQGSHGGTEWNKNLKLLLTVAQSHVVRNVDWSTELNNLNVKY